MPEYDIERINAMWQRVQPRMEAAVAPESWPSPLVEPAPPVPSESIPPAPPAERADAGPATVQSDCFGTSFSEDEKALQALVHGEHRITRQYMALAKTTHGRSITRLLDKRTRKQKQLTGRLSTAYFLMTGEQAAPPESMEIPARKWFETARELFHAERKAMTQYRQIEERTQDGCLRELCGQAAAGKKEASDELLRLLEVYVCS